MSVLKESDPQTLDTSNLKRPKVQLGHCELDLELVEDFRHFVFHRNELKYKSEFFIQELEKAMRTHMYLNKEVRSYNNTTIDHFIER